MGSIGRTLCLAAGLAACGGPEVAPPAPTPYVFDGADDAPPQVDLGVIGRELQELAPALLRLDATPPLTAYAALVGEQTATCPRVYAVDGNVYWADQCTTDAGTVFSGYGFYYDYADWPVGDVWRGRVRLLSGAARIARADGASIEVAGAAQRMDLHHVDQPVRLYHSVVNGSFDVAGIDLGQTWLQTSLRPDLTTYVYEQTEIGGRMIFLDGGVSGLPGSLTAVVFDQVTLVEERLGGACPAEPHGLVSVRLADGTWIDLQFDGFDTQTWQATGPCDGVGRAFHRGALIGEVTLDLSSLFDFEGSPW
jgi:hypothetical protein